MITLVTLGGELRSSCKKNVATNPSLLICATQATFLLLAIAEFIPSQPHLGTAGGACESSGLHAQEERVLTLRFNSRIDDCFRT